MRREPLQKIWRNFIRLVYREVPNRPLKKRLQRREKVNPYELFLQREGNSTYEEDAQLENRWLFLTPPDGRLAAAARGEVANFLAEHPTAEIIYCDEDLYDAEKGRHTPYLKPGWSPELLLAYNYIRRPLAIQREVWKKLEGINPQMDEPAFWAFLLRAMEIGVNIAHLPKILMHKEQGEEEVQDRNLVQRQSQILQFYLQHQRIPASPIFSSYWAFPNQPIFHLRWPDTGPLVSILIPSKNNLRLLRACIRSLKKTRYHPYEIIVLDNASDDRATLDYLDQIKQESHIQVIRIPNIHDRFSFAYINNQGVNYAKGELLVFLNDDTEVISPDWLSQLVGYHQIEGVGMVGAKLLYRDRSIQHIGVAMNMYTGTFEGFPLHYYSGQKSRHPKLIPLTQASRNVGGVTAACCLISKKLFQTLGGFDEKSFPVSLNDMDLCIRVRKKGLRIVFASQAVLLHKESKSRKGLLELDEMVAFKQKYPQPDDPYYPANYSRIRAFQIAPVPKTKDPILAKKTPQVSFVESASETCLSWHQLKRALAKGKQWEVNSPSLQTDVLVGKGTVAIPLIKKAQAQDIPFIWYLDHLPRADHVPLYEAAFCLIAPSHRIRLLVEQLAPNAVVEVVKMAIETERDLPNISKAEARRQLGIQDGQIVSLLNDDPGGENLKAYLHRMTAGMACQYLELGNQDSLPKSTWKEQLAFRAADIFVNAAMHSTDMSYILQAMRFGLPIVSYVDIGVEEYVWEDVNARLVPTGNKRFLANKLEEMARNEAGREHAAEMSNKVFQLNTTFEGMVGRIHTVMMPAVLTKE